MKNKSVTMSLIFVLLIFGNCDNTSSPPPPGDEVVKEIDDSGGTIEWKNVTVDIPENALSSEATVTLKSPDYNIEDSLDVVIVNEPFSISIDGATLQDTIYVTLPPFIAISDWDVVGFEISGIWYPLVIVEENTERIRVAIPQEITMQALGKYELPKYSATITSGTVAQFEGTSLVQFPDDISLQLETTENPTDPAIVLIHGILRDRSRWNSEYIQAMSLLGEVYTLEYPWTDNFMNQVSGIIDTLNQRFGSRDIYLVGHSKGGIIARAVIRENEIGSYYLNIKKALFYGTPHYGSDLGVATGVALYWPIWGLIKVSGILDQNGVTELLPGSSALGEINQPLSFGGILPMYKCIVGDFLETSGDLLVMTTSADLSTVDHAGERENATYTLTPAYYSCWHGDLGKYNQNTWGDVVEFLNTSDEQLDPIAYYPFSGSADDESGHGNHGVVNGATLTEDRFGNQDCAYRFDGSDDWIFIEDSPDFHFSDKFTISVWIKNDTGAPYSYPYHIIEKYGSWEIRQREMDMLFSFADQSELRTETPTDIEEMSDLAIGEWYNFVMTYDGQLESHNYKIYANGVMIYSTTCPGRTVYDTSSNVVISYYEPEPNKNGIGYYFDGVIDDIALFNRALTQSEIQRIYNNE